MKDHKNSAAFATLRTLCHASTLEPDQKRVVLASVRRLEHSLKTKNRRAAMKAAAAIAASFIKR